MANEKRRARRSKAVSEPVTPSVPLPVPADEIVPPPLPAVQTESVTAEVPEAPNGPAYEIPKEIAPPWSDIEIPELPDELKELSLASNPVEVAPPPITVVPMDISCVDGITINGNKFGPGKNVMVPARYVDAVNELDRPYRQ